MKGKGLAYDDLVKKAPPLTVARFMQCLAAAHMSWRVESPTEDRGGIILVAPPAAIKSTLIGKLDARYHDVLEVTDLNSQALTKMRDSFVSGRYNTLVLPEMNKLYQRNPSVAANIEGYLNAMTAEGFKAASFEVSGIGERPARALVIGAMTPAIRREHTGRWADIGFDRRFIWPVFSFKMHYLHDSLERWERMPLPWGTRISLNGTDTIPAVVTRTIGKKLMELCAFQPTDPSLQMQIMGRIYSVLAWAYVGKRRNPRESAWGTVLAFARTLGPNGTDLLP